MSDQGGTLAGIARHLALALQPLVDAVADKESFRAFLYQLGWSATDMPPQYSQLADAVSDALVKLEALSDPPRPSQVTALIDAVLEAFTRITNIDTAPPGVDPGPFLAEIGDRLFENLLTSYLAAALPGTYAALQALDVIHIEPVDAAGNRPSFVRVRLDWSAVPKLISEPASIPQRVYGWGTSDLDHDGILDHLSSLFVALGFPVRTTPPDDELIRGLVAGNLAAGVPMTSPSLIVPFYYVELQGKSLEPAVVLHGVPAANGALPGIAIEPRLPAEFPLTMKLADTITLRITAGTNVATTLGVVIRPGEIAIRYPFEPGTTPPSAGIGVGVDLTPRTPTMLIGAPGATRLQFTGASVDAAVQSIDGQFDASLAVALKALTLVLTAGEDDSFVQGSADGFLASILPSEGITATVDLEVVWSRRGGLNIRGGTGLSTVLDLHQRAGPLRVDSLALGLEAGPEELTGTVGVAGDAAIGPVTASVAGFGAAVVLRFARGNLGPVDLVARFRPPDGVGLTVDTGPVTGGGFLFHDEARHLYAGVMQLSIHESITVKAFGLITTLMPDGSPGFSLIVFITVEDFRPIPLGWGFTLLGIGGMVAVNRTFDQEVIRQGLASGILATLLFPRDPVGEAPTLIRNLAAAFPPRQGSYLLGLLARIGWFTPPLVLMDLALILEFGARQRLLALGRISALLPSADNDLVRLNMEAVGVIDFDAGTVAIDAVLVDSRLAHKFPITGAAALRAELAGRNIVLSVGGFNPRFAPPPNVPALARLAIALSSGDNPRLICQAYFAITSNTVQFGAHAALYASAIGFSVEGEVGFDVLMQPVTLHFIADFVARVQLKRGSHNLFMVKLSGALQGPRPLRVSGEATFEILWCDFTVRFDKTLVSGELPPLPAAVNVLTQLVEALGLPSSWRTQPGATETHGVALRSLPPAGPKAPIVLDPLGRILINQQVVPLNTDIDIFGGAPVAEPRRFTLTATLGAIGPPQPPQLLDGAPHREPFAPAQFVAMTDDEKLSAPSFVSMDAGAVFGAAGAVFDKTEDGIIPAPLEDYESVVITLDGAPTVVPSVAAPAPYTLTTAGLRALTGSGAAARAPVRRVGWARYRNEAAEPGATFVPQRWLIMPIGEGQPHPVDPSVRTWSDYRQVVKALNRGGARWQLVPAHEIPELNPDA